MTNLDAIWLAEYSPIQGSFNIETAREAIENNVRQILGGYNNSYLPFAFCSTHEQAMNACDSFAAEMERQGGRVIIPGAMIRMPTK